jgi:hypothetical protein
MAKPDFILCAAKALSNLMSETCTRLVLDMYLFLATSVKLAVDCLCTPEIVDNTPPLFTYYLYSAVTHLCAPHLSHCILRFLYEKLYTKRNGTTKYPNCVVIICSVHWICGNFFYRRLEWIKSLKPATSTLAYFWSAETLIPTLANCW